MTNRSRRRPGNAYLGYVRMPASSCALLRPRNDLFLLLHECRRGNAIAHLPLVSCTFAHIFFMYIQLCTIHCAEAFRAACASLSARARRTQRERRVARRSRLREASKLKGASSGSAHKLRKDIAASWCRTSKFSRVASKLSSAAAGVRRICRMCAAEQK